MPVWLCAEMRTILASVSRPAEDSGVDQLIGHPDNSEDKNQHKHDALPRLQRPTEPDDTKNRQAERDENQQHGSSIATSQGSFL